MDPRYVVYIILSLIIIAALGFTTFIFRRNSLKYRSECDKHVDVVIPVAAEPYICTCHGMDSKVCVEPNWGNYMDYSTPCNN